MFMKSSLSLCRPQIIQFEAGVVVAETREGRGSVVSSSLR